MLRRTIIVFAAILLFLPAVTRAQSTEDQAVRAAVNQYFRGHSTGDAAEMRKAFLPTV